MPELDTPTPSSVASLQTDNTELLVEQIRALVQLNQSAIQAGAAERTAYKEMFDGLLAGVVDLVARVEATLDVMEQFLGNINQSVEEIKNVTRSLIEIQNNLVLLMTEGMQQ